MNYWDTDESGPGTGQERKKYVSKKQIVRHLYRSGSLSSADITALIQLSIPTTLAYLNELIDEGYVENRGKGDSVGGRRPSVYGLVKDSAFVLGIEIGRKELKIGLFNGELEKVAGVAREVDRLPESVDAVDYVYNIVMQMLADHTQLISKIIGVGIVMPGLVDSAKGINHSYLNFGGESLSERFSKKFKLPVILENDAKARTLAEMKMGAARMVPNAMLILVEWGLGLGMILDGKLYKGRNGFAGELSHIPIEANGVLCNCGKVGCLETIASGQALVRSTLEALEAGSNSLLTSLYNENFDLITPKVIVDAAKKGDALAIHQISMIGSALGKGISYLIQILNPGVVIIGGVLSDASEYLLTSLQQSLYQFCLPQLRENVEIRQSPLDADACVIGAAALMMDHALAL